jgi:hypothetical protein
VTLIPEFEGESGAHLLQFALLCGLEVIGVVPGIIKIHFSKPKIIFIQLLIYTIH